MRRQPALGTRCHPAAHGKPPTIFKKVVNFPGDPKKRSIIQI
jgi:hypothetical protein